MCNEKCNKYEELFVKEDETELLEHIKVCPDCAKEYENMQKVSNLVKEVSFAFRQDMKKKRLQTKITAIAATFFVSFLAFFAVQLFSPNSYVNDTIAYFTGNDYTYEQMGLPVDDYGFIMVDLEY